ncbi:hypothetical protein [Armatimonas sp.]|uniref:hypothetical protein n=1 Tax=Armatimonas sp. TaxID=1872638 RepID=UPI00286B4881|nr:hypothetical protein [Armatimonas sp.]
MKRFVLLASIAIFGALTTSAWAQEPRPLRQLSVNGFRSPSIGLEYRQGAYSLHTGYYTSILSQSDSRNKRSTAFIKTGVSHYFGGDQKREWFVSAAHVRGRTEGWKKDGAFLEAGGRWQVAKRLELRLGAGLLLVSGKPARLNPTPGISYTIPLH